MTLNTVQEQYNAYKKGLITEARFTQLLRFSAHNRLFSGGNSIKDKIQILKNHKLIFELKSVADSLEAAEPIVQLDTVSNYSQHEYRLGLGQETDNGVAADKLDDVILGHLSKNPNYYSERIEAGKAYLQEDLDPTVEMNEKSAKDPSQFLGKGISVGGQNYAITGIGGSDGKSTIVNLNRGNLVFHPASIDFQNGLKAQLIASRFGDRTKNIPVDEATASLLSQLSVFINGRNHYDLTDFNIQMSEEPRNGIDPQLEEEIANTLKGINESADSLQIDGQSYSIEHVDRQGEVIAIKLTDGSVIWINDKKIELAGPAGETSLLAHRNGAAMSASVPVSAATADQLVKLIQQQDPSFQYKTNQFHIEGQSVAKPGLMDRARNFFKEEADLEEELQKTLDELSPGIHKAAAQKASQVGKFDQSSKFHKAYDQSIDMVNKLFHNKPFLGTRINVISIDRGVLTIQTGGPAVQVYIDQKRYKISPSGELTEQDKRTIQSILDQAIPGGGVDFFSSATSIDESEPSLEQRLMEVLAQFPAKQ